ncbi:MAG: phage major capsid protein, partial [Romboutsia timonensis]
MSDIIYEASQHSVLLGNCPVLPMDEGTVLIGKVKDGIELDFKEKYAEGKQADLGLEGITLEAKTLYAYVIIAEEDLQDLKNLDSILRKAFSMAVAETLDNNFLYTNLNSSSKPGVYPSGILDNPGIKQISVQSADYDMIAKAKLELAKANGKANTVGYNPIESFKIQTMKDSTGQYINPPSFYNELSKIESNGLKPNDVIVFDSNQILVGIRKQMDIKMLPDLENGTVIMRCMLRADVLPVREDHICKITIEEDEEESKRS